MRTLLTVFFAFLVLAGTNSVVRADYFVWQDSKTGLSLSFPDTWQQINNANPDDLITIMAPSGRAHASCRVRAQEDRRYLVYPSHYDATIQEDALSVDFWHRYLREYDNSRLDVVYDGASFGRGFAGFALAGYESAVPGPMMNRQAMMFASLYNDTLYVLECSSHRDAFDFWRQPFMEIADSVDFRKADHEVFTGDYRNFMGDKRILFKGDIRGDTIVSY